MQKAKGSSGTVGAVALDSHGNLAAATTTGGMTNKLPGRVGDTPVVGAGTYAKNDTCAISATGHGELFIAHAVCATASAYMECGVSFAEALERVVHERLPDGTGGLVAVGPNGEQATPTNFFTSPPPLSLGVLLPGVSLFVVCCLCLWGPWLMLWQRVCMWRGGGGPFQLFVQLSLLWWVQQGVDMPTVPLWCLQAKSRRRSIRQ